MEQASNINEPANNNKRTNPLTALAFMEIGIFEIGFVIISLLLIFGTLNYFNILPVSETFPKYLGWLPSQRAGDIYRNKTNNQAYNDFLKQYYASRKEVPSGTSRPTPTIKRHPYDIVKAKNVLDQYIKNNLKSELLPAKLDIKQTDPISSPTEDLGYEFTSSFTLKSSTASSYLHYRKNTNSIDDMGISINLPDLEKTTLSLSLANSLMSSYFANPSSISNCVIQTRKSYCEVFKEETDGKRGFGIAFEDRVSFRIRNAFACFIPKESVYYLTQKSCIEL